MLTPVVWLDTPTRLWTLTNGFLKCQLPHRVRKSKLSAKENDTDPRETYLDNAALDFAKGIDPESETRTHSSVRNRGWIDGR